ncbi:MAG: radical SAM protein [Desulfobacterales bacterium]|nr:radical SAM protein [Desulfobacterales bacterium]
MDKAVHLFSHYLPFLNAGLAILKGRLQKRVFPWYLNFFITSKCNLRCPYCYIIKYRSEQKEPSLEALKRIVDDFYRLGTRYFALLGGEPLLRKDLSELIDYLTSKNVLIGMNTNGTIPLDRHISMLKKLNKITFSLEGERKDHDKDRGVGSYDKIIENMTILKRNRINQFSIQTTITASTLHSWQHVLDIAKIYGSTVLFTEISCQPGEKTVSADIDSGQLVQIWEKIRNLKLKGFPVENSFEAINNMITYGKHIGPFQFFESFDAIPPYLKKFTKNSPCSFGRYAAFLNYDGNLYPCASLFGIEKYKYNIYELSIKKAYQCMSSNHSCRLCRGLLGYQIHLLFSSLDFSTLLQLAKIAFNNYNYKNL